MSGRKLKKGKTKAKRISKLNNLDTDLNLTLSWIKSYWKDLTEELGDLSTLTGKTIRFQRFEKLSTENISLGEGQDPPAGKINPNYQQQPSNPRRCIQCGKPHDCIVEDMTTGERLKEIDKCLDCLILGGFKKK